MLKKLLCIILLLPSLAFAETFTEGTDYQVLQNKLPATKGQKVHVREFFSFGCHWCYQVEPLLDQWLDKQDNNINFTRTPVIFNKDWVYYAKAYYTAKMLGINNKIDPLIFKMVQEEKKNLTSQQAMIDLFVSQGVDKATAESAFINSTTIDMAVNDGNKLMMGARINAVPAFIINGHYKTDLKMAQNPQRLIEILNFLVEKEKQQVQGAESQTSTN